ncbi:hypothetical protein [Candidatus Neptunochlamydia vexilliferae]|uniref:Fascin domain-containing protein n=1 Tax=Candidatus Neptunichlamydia vexilliferae TaxID=1651774 RepID=A0ABS0B0T9_9BACT|nr:hypothetical protein [Candidatus Neptunochlamydia vexilliferae]MBF5060013.1 hypothetical protein [Candidatus Neptunochlamydia vexilliferae]
MSATIKGSNSAQNQVFAEKRFSEKFIHLQEQINNLKGSIILSCNQERLYEDKGYILTDPIKTNSASNASKELNVTQIGKGLVELDFIDGRNLYISSANSELFGEKRGTHTNTDSVRRQFKITQSKKDGYINLSLTDGRNIYFSSIKKKFYAEKKGPQDFKIIKTAQMSNVSVIRRLMQQTQKYIWCLELPTGRELYVSSADRTPYAEKRKTHTNTDPKRRNFKVIPVDGEKEYFEFSLEDGRELYASSESTHNLYAHKRGCHTNISEARRRFKITPIGQGYVNLSLEDGREVCLSSANDNLYAEKRGTHTNNSNLRRDFRLVPQG